MTASLHDYMDYTPHPSPRMVPDDIERWKAEAAAAGLSRLEVERRIAEQRAGSDQHNGLHILLDHPGPNVEPVKQWSPLAEGVALLLDDSRNPELAFHDHIKRKREEWAREERADRRQHHVEREAARKREIDAKNAQICAHLPIACALAQMALECEGAERATWTKAARLVFAFEAAGNALRTPSTQMAKLFGLETFEPTPFTD